MSDDTSLRRKMLNEHCIRQGWISRKAAGEQIGSASELVMRLGRTSSFWSDRLRGVRPIGADLAREIEEKLELPRYYLEGDAVWPFTRALQQEVNKLSPSDLVFAENALRAHLRMPPIAPLRSNDAPASAAGGAPPRRASER